MATCIIELTADISSGANYDYPIVTTGVSLSVAFSPLVKQKLFLATSKQETIVCSLNVGVSGPMSITFFRVNADGQTLTNVGGVTTTDNTTTFQKDVTPGEYYICFSSSTTTTSGTFTCQFSGFVSETRMPSKGYAGESLLGDLTIFKKERFCNEPMTFSLVSGELPPGCTLQVDGSIKGPLPDLDCIDKTIDAFSPSVNWFYEDNQEKSRPIPRRWLFTAKVTLVNFPHITAVETFSIEVYNDWTKDRDAFMLDAVKGFDRYDDIPVITPIVKIDPNLLVTSAPTTSTPATTNVVVDCPTCGNADINKDAAFVSWYINDYLANPTPEISAFINKFKTTQKFKEIAAVYGNSSITTSTINNIIVNSIPTDGIRSPGDIDYLFLELGHKLNMKLPTEAFGYTGELFQVMMQ